MDGRSVCLTKWIWFCPATRGSCGVTIHWSNRPVLEHKTLNFVAPFFKHQLVPTKLPRFFRQHRQTNKKPEASVEVGIELSNGTKEFDSSCTWTMAWGTSALGWIPKGWLSHSVTVYPVNHLKKDIKLMPYQLVSRIFCVRKYPVDFWRRLGRRFWWISKALFHQDVFFQCYCFNRSIWISEYCRSNPDHGWFSFHDFPCSHLNGWTSKLLGFCRAGPAGWFKQ